MRWCVLFIASIPGLTFFHGSLSWGWGRPPGWWLWHDSGKGRGMLWLYCTVHCGRMQGVSRFYVITCKLLSDLWNKYQDKHDPKVAHSGPSHVLASQGGSQTPKLNWDNWDLHNCQLSAGGTYSSLVPCWLGEKYFSRPERGKLEFCPRKEIIEESLSLYLGQIWMLE